MANAATTCGTINESKRRLGVLGSTLRRPVPEPDKNGIHPKEALLQPPSGIADLEAYYGADNITPSTIWMITIAPELDPTTSVISSLATREIVVSVGHSNATYEEMTAAVHRGATMIMHLLKPSPRRITGTGDSRDSRDSRGSGSPVTVLWDCCE